MILYFPASRAPTGIFDSLGTGLMDATLFAPRRAPRQPPRVAGFPPRVARFRCYLESVQAPREELWVIGEIAAEAAHELRNALAVIAASSELLRSADDAQRASLVAKIHRNARMAQGVLDALMALARGDELHGEPVSIAHAIAEARRDVPAAL